MVYIPYQYDKHMFENKLVKRGLYTKLISSINEYKDRGSIVTLIGPALETHYNELRPILRPRSDLLMAEYDSDLIKRECIVERIKNLHDDRITFFKGDVWDSIKKRYKNCGWHHKHVLFDMDFCCTAKTAFDNGLTRHLEWLITSKLPRRKGFWISLTFCRRKDTKEIWRSLPSDVLYLYGKYGWSMTEERVITYTEKSPNKKGRVGANMVMMWFRFRNY